MMFNLKIIFGNIETLACSPEHGVRQGGVEACIQVVVGCALQGGLGHLFNHNVQICRVEYIQSWI